MSGIRYSLLTGVGLFLAGCGIPPALMVASYVAQGALVATSGKTFGGYALSAVVQQDCAMWRVLRGDNICQPPLTVADDDILLAAGEALAPAIGAEDSAAIQLAQVYLNDLGYGAGPIDGIAGSQTQAAVQAYQAEIGRQADGVLTYDDLTELSRQFGEGADRPGLVDDPVTTVLLAQAHLAYFGYRPGPLDGISGPVTRDAIIHFQRAKGLEADGQADAALLAILRSDLPDWQAQSIAATPRPELRPQTAAAG